jgi:hypothetical protein
VSHAALHENRLPVQRMPLVMNGDALSVVGGMTGAKTSFWRCAVLTRPAHSFDSHLPERQDAFTENVVNSACYTRASRRRNFEARAKIQRQSLNFR